MNVISDIAVNKTRIGNSFQRLISQCDINVSTVMQNLPLIISDDLKAESIYTDPIFKKAYINGFGCLKGNIFFEGNKTHFLVLNITNIDAQSLTDEEFDGVLAHELGHIFNVSPQIPIPSVIHGATMDETNNARAKNLKNAEFYADYFSKMTNSSTGLLASMQKYLASENPQNEELFLERIEMLSGSDTLLGTTLEIRK